MTELLTTKRNIVNISKGFYVVIPKLWIDANKLKKGDPVLLNVYKDKIIISKTK